MPITLKKSSLKYKDPEGNMKDIGLPVGGVITDTALTKSGTPADAKIVGDKFKEMQQSINEIKADIGEGGGSSFSGKASDVSYDDTESKLGVDNVQDAIDKLSEQIDDLESEIVDFQNKTIPKVFFSGDITDMTKEVSVDLEMEYKDGKNDFECVVNMKWQGNSSLSYDKKNFTIKMFTDSTKATKLKKNFRGWGEQNKYCLKANYIDHSHARNIVSARLWADMVASRENVPTLLANAPNYGAVDGFPIKLYMNGVYQGLYTWNIPKDDWTYGITDDTTQAVLSGQHSNGDKKPSLAPTTEFRGLWNGSAWWELEIGTLSDTLIGSWDSVINFVMTASDTDFVANLNNYLDVESVIDYYLFMYLNCGSDNLGNNLLTVYDGNKWYLSAYDMDATWGLTWNGASYNNYNMPCPSWYAENNSLLFQRVEKLMYAKLKERYTELRNGALSFANIINRFEEFTDIISNDLYEEDTLIFADIPNADTNNIRQIRTYMKQRGEYVDSCISALNGTSFCDVNSDGIDDYKTINKITCEFIQGDLVVYNTTDLSVLKDKLTVWAWYTDGTTSKLYPHAYALSGTLTGGTNTVTVTVNGKTTTFTVNVTKAGSTNIVTLDTTDIRTGRYSNSGKAWKTDCMNTAVTFLVPTGTLKIRVRYSGSQQNGNNELALSYKTVFLGSSVTVLTGVGEWSTLVTTEANGDSCLTIDNSAGNTYCSIPFNEINAETDLIITINEEIS